MKALFLILFTIALSGCGQEGALYLPHAKSEASPIVHEKVRS